jgi:hypothetical protein
MNTSIIEKELQILEMQERQIEAKKKALKVLLPFYQNGVIEIQRDFPTYTEPKVYKKSGNSKSIHSIHSQIVDLAGGLSDLKGIVTSKQVLDAAMENNLMPENSRDQVSRRISNTFGLEVQRKHFKKIKPGKYKIKG